MKRSTRREGKTNEDQRRVCGREAEREEKKRERGKETERETER